MLRIMHSSFLTVDDGISSSLILYLTPKATQSKNLSFELRTKNSKARNSAQLVETLPQPLLSQGTQSYWRPTLFDQCPLLVYSNSLLLYGACG